jgi:DNA-binding IclR family transcriptional regulator
MPPKAREFGHKYEVQNVHLILDILQVLSVSRSGKSLAAFVEKIPETSKNKIFRILHTLESHTFITKNTDGEYLLGPWAYKMARSILANDNTISMARSVQEQLAAATQEAVYLGVLKEDEATLIELVECKKMVRAANCIGASLLITNGDLIENTPASKIYVAKNTLMNDVTTIAAVFNTGKKAPPLALVLVVPALRISEQRLTSQLAPLMANYAERLTEMYGLRDLKLHGAAILGALLFREKRAEDMFDEIEVRQITGIGITKASDH